MSHSDKFNSPLPKSRPYFRIFAGILCVVFVSNGLFTIFAGKYPKDYEEIVICLGVGIILGILAVRGTLKIKL